MPRVNSMGRQALRLSLCALLTLVTGIASATDRSKVAVVVDDLGNQWQSGLAAIQIPFIQTIAIMPGLPYTIPLAESTVDAGKTVIVHAPMSNESNFPLGRPGTMATSNCWPTSRWAWTPCPSRKGSATTWAAG